ncbi:Septin-9 [Ceratobasidium sp. AG-Ba]|nr:Septin-9 [Ceratobasidium sp. AG-Ba]
MVLGLSIRKKKQSTELPKPVRTPSLPDIRAQSLVWPESLVDLPLYNRQTPVAPKHAAPPSSFPRAQTAPSRRASIGSRRTRAAAPFNLMVAGPRGVGKSALLRLLLQMSDPPAPFDLSSRPTKALATSTVELHGAERLLLTVVDTPGLDYSDGAELELEKAVTALVKHIDSQYAETLGEESKVIRQSKGDRHVHLCIYLIDPSSVQSHSQRTRTSRSHTALPRSDTPESSSNDSDYDSDSEDRIGLAPSEIRAIQRLARRTNILPVIAKGDMLTNDRLEKVRKAVRRDLIRAGVDMRIFGVAEDDSMPERGRTDSRVTLMQGQQDEADRKVIKIRPTRRPSRARSTQRPDDEVPPELPPKPTGLGLDTGAGPESSPTAAPDVHYIPPIDDPTLARMLPLVIIAPDASKPKRSSKPKAPALSVSPEPEVPGTPTAITTDSPDLPSAELGVASGSVNGHGSKAMSPISSSRSPSGYPSAVLPPSSWRPSIGNGPRQYSEDGGKSEGRTYPRGVFTRKYRWGTIDVLDPAHCDVGVLRSVVLGSHMNALKTHTREVLYEKYRTEKLLARRATQNITPEQRSRLMKGLDP